MEKEYRVIIPNPKTGDVVEDNEGNTFIQLNYWQATALFMAVASTNKEMPKLENSLGLNGLFNTSKRSKFANTITGAGIYLILKHLPNFGGDGAKNFLITFNEILKQILGKYNHSLLQYDTGEYDSFNQEELLSKMSEFVVLEVFSGIDSTRFDKYKNLILDYLNEMDKKLNSAEDLYIITGSMPALVVIALLKAP